jgi:all-trans-retinol dehydrogenase (NAD+)
MSQIKDRTALITGGASGIGYLMGRELLQAGAKRLVIWDIQEDALQKVVTEFTGQGFQVAGFKVNVADNAQIGETIRRMELEGMVVDVLINNAGIVVGRDFAEHSPEDIARTMEINAVAPMQVTRCLLPGMMERRSGHIVNIASAAGMMSNPRMSVYCASKWAVIGWSDSLRLEMDQRRSGIKVTTVTPYYIDTGMFAGVRSPLLPLLKPESVARKIVDAIEKDKIFLRLPWLVNFLPLLRGLLPTRWFDRIVGEWLGVYRSMSTFQGRRNSP